MNRGTAWGGGPRTSPGEWLEKVVSFHDTEVSGIEDGFN